MLNKLRGKQRVMTESPLRESLNRQINVSNLVIKHLNIFSSTKHDDCKRDLEKTNIEDMSSYRPQSWKVQTLQVLELTCSTSGLAAIE